MAGLRRGEEGGGAMATARGVLFAWLVGLIGIVTSVSGGSSYTVGGLAGWDMSTDLLSWAAGKAFVPGDVLNFQFSRYYDLNEVTKVGFDSCNSSDAMSSSKGGNATIALTKPGPRYFICGVRLYCLSGMKLQVNTLGDVQAGSPAPAPAPAAYPPFVYQPRPQPLLPRSSGSPTNEASSSAPLPTTPFGKGKPLVYFAVLCALRVLF